MWTNNRTHPKACFDWNYDRIIRYSEDVKDILIVTDKEYQIRSFTIVVVLTFCIYLLGVELRTN